ncbi:hypothetical protein [Nocardiopsis chromatogenes]|uniref:hypothetical protein n=1 Tax=Nocardiopsis chromatogenes TaxID=280239 RepID=UPI000347315C|nr:hypothetical protein [Nocardiopsis chromatogenes]
MNEPFDEGTEERLRAILRAEADSVEPSPEALNAIRDRTQNRRSPLWSGLPWLRPVLAVGAAAAIAGSVLMGTPQLREQIFFAANNAGTPEQERPDGGGAGRATDDTGHAERPEGDGGATGGKGGGAPSPDAEEDGDGTVAGLPEHCRTPAPPDEDTPVPTSTGRQESDAPGDGSSEQDPDCDPDRPPGDGGDGSGDGGGDGSGDGGDTGGGDTGGGDTGGDGGGDSGGDGSGDGGSDDGGGSPSPDPDQDGGDGGTTDVPVE